MGLRTVDVLGSAAHTVRRLGLNAVLRRAVGVADAVFVSSGRGPIGVEVNGASVRGYLRHRSYLSEAARPGTTYAPLFIATLSPEATVVDAGAHVGVFTVLAAPRCAHVVAFEPDPYNLRALRANVRQLANVRLVEKALSDSLGEGTFYVTPSTIGSSLIERAGGEPQLVQTTTIDAELSGRPIGSLVLKLNIEGAELRALDGARETLARASDVTMFVEVNPALAHGEDIEDWLAAEGFDMAYIDLPSQQPVPLPSPRCKGHLLATRVSSRAEA